LKILCVIESGSWIELHIAGSLREAGHTVEVFSYGEGVGEFYGQRRRDELEKKNRLLLATARELRRSPGLDLVFCYVYDDFLLGDTARALSRLDVPLVNYNVDMLNQWYRQTRTAKHFTRMLCAQRVNMDLLARYNPRVLHFPMAARAQADSQRGPDDFRVAAPVTFAGTPMPFRLAVLGRLHRAGIPLAVYGKFWLEGRQAASSAGLEKTLADLRHYAWPKFRAEGMAGLLRAVARRMAPSARIREDDLPRALLHGFIPEGQMNRLFEQSRVNLGFSRMAGDDPEVKGLNQVKLRDFEVPMAGGFYLVERAEEYDAYFKAGSDVATWETPGELIEKIRYYLDHDAERAAIAQAGRRRALAEHTWNRRFDALFADLGLAEH